MNKILIFLSAVVLVSCSSRPSLNEIELRNEPISIKKEKAELYFSIAQSLEENGMTEKAIENYQEALKIMPNHYESRYSLGRVLLARGFKSEGLKEVNRSLAINAKYTKARNFLVSYYLSSPKTYEKAKQLVDESVKDLTYQNQEETWSLKLRADLKVGGKELALKSAIKTASIPAVSCKNRFSIASSFYKMDLLGPALNSARAAYDLCYNSDYVNRVSYLKGLIFIKKRNLFVAEKILNEIDTEDKKLKIKLTKAQIFVRKKINSGM